MRIAKHYLGRLRGRAGWLGTSLLMMPILFWVWLPAPEIIPSFLNGNVARFIISGDLFFKKFNIVHTGTYLDQPTIFKWLFWFTFFALSSLPWAMAVRWLSNRSKWGGYLAYGICATILGVFLLCILTWPVLWLIQYIATMGITPRRIAGLLYTVASSILVIGFMVRAFRMPPQNNCETTAPKTVPTDSASGTHET